jgi:hypothetical protein
LLPWEPEISLSWRDADPQPRIQNTVYHLVWSVRLSLPTFHISRLRYSRLIRWPRHPHFYLTSRWLSTCLTTLHQLL